MDMNPEFAENFVMDTKVSLANHETRIVTLEETVKDIKDLTMSVREIALNQRAMDEKIDDLSQTVRSITEEPKKNWSTLKASIISALGGALGTGIISGIVALIVNNAH